MGSRRTVAIIVSVALAGVSSILAYGYLRSVQARADHGAKLAQVYFVKKPVPKGASGADALANGSVALGSLPAKYRPATAIVSGAEISGRVALVDLVPDQIVVQGLFADAAASATTNSQRLEPGQVGVAISLDAIRGLGGLISPGDVVNIMTPVSLSKKNLSAANQAYLKDAADGDRGWALLYQNVKILFIGTASAPEPGESKPADAPPAGGAITFAVPPEAAMRIVYAANDSAGGGLYLTLVPPGNQPVDVAPVVNVNEFGPPCQTPGPDARYGTADDQPAACVPLAPYPPTPARPTP